MSEPKDVRPDGQGPETARTAGGAPESPPSSNTPSGSTPSGRRADAGPATPGLRDLHGRDRRRGSSKRTLLLVAAALGAMAGAGALSAVLSGGGTPVAPKQPAGSNVAVSTSASSQSLHATDAELMGLVKLHGKPAPGFTLTDQNGKTVSLAQLDQNHAVVLGFMDDTCRDICPIVAQELTDAYHNLGAKAKTVVFVGINVNAAHPAPATLRAFIAKKGHGIGTVPNFYYLTGSPQALKKIWKDYGITVRTARTGTLVHSEGLWFISPGGAERYQATPFANERKNGTGWLPPPTITQWGQGIAKFAAKVAG